MTVSLLAISVDCDDAAQLAGFWSALLDRPVDDDASTAFASIGLGSAPTPGDMWMFHQVPEKKTAKNRTHIDLVSDNLAKSVAHAVDLGATRLGDYDEGGYQWTTLTDPEGNEFDIVASPF